MKPKLKSLELHGYKTFAGRVLFEFPGNVTAIVGPNGSGKSNISDAIRWVLGEQSYSLLRGKKTEDMIFLGSDQRPKAGMASATIQFDNEDSWLPIDYSEVAVSRRAYRDGSNEYLLNKQRVRLKDISELLAQSGLAERTYTIIGQGSVDAALSLRPEERRKFFEEAAGIGLFRSRREEALTRLDTTRRNLERVTDILGELEPRLRSLERQAKRVEEYDQVKTDLQVLLKDWYGYHWQNSQKELLRNREILRNQEEKVSIARDKRGELEKKVDRVRLHLQELRGQLNTWHMESADLHRVREKVSREIAVLEERLRSYSEQKVSLQSDLIHNEQLASTYQEKSASLLEENEKLNQELQDCQEQAVVVQDSFNLRKEERDRLEQSLNQARKNLVALETNQLQLKAHQKELQNRVETFGTSRTHLKDSIEKNKAALSIVQQKLTQISDTKRELENSSKENVEAISRVSEKISKHEDEQKRITQEISCYEIDLARANAQMEVIEQAELAFSGMGEGAKSLLSAVSNGKLPGKLLSVSNYMDVPPELEIAVSAALGEQLDAIMYGEGTDPETILAFLESDESGRAMLIPVDRTRPIEKLGKFYGNDVIGLASDLVKSNESNQNLIAFLLGQVLIVKDRKVAREMIKDLPVLSKVVTLKGEVFNGNGVIIAGKEKRSAIFSRPRQKKELQDKLVQLGEQRSVRTNELSRLLEDLKSLQSEKRNLEGKGKEIRNRELQVSQAFSSEERNLVQLNQQLEWQNSQTTLLINQQNNAELEITNIQIEIDSSQGEIAEKDQSIKEINGNLRLVPLDELQAQLVHWNTTQAITSRALKEASVRYIEFEATMKQNAALIDQLNKRMEDLAKLEMEAEGELSNSKIDETTINSQIAASSQKIEPAEGELNVMEIEYSGLQHEYSLLQQSETNADRVFTQAQLEFSRSREALESLRRHIEDDFGLVALEYSEEVSGPTPLPLEEVGQLTPLSELPKGLEEAINRQRALLRRMGAINPEARKEYLEVKERHVFLTTQVADLQKADNDLRQIISELDELMHRQFRTTFNAVAAEFKEMFSRLFGGGSARLIMTDANNPTETGIDIEARLPGRREQGLSLLSGGERALTAVALIFSLLRVSPTPFCILDEVDAMLDEANVGRFTELLLELSRETQFIVITHNRNTVQVADVIYGVTMGRDSASQVISLRLDEVTEELVK